MDELEYITGGALVMCDRGAAPAVFRPTCNRTAKIHGCLIATQKDFLPLTNIPSFKVCAVTQTPCAPATTPWQNTWRVRVKGQETLIGRSTCQCTVGGTIEFLTSGQIPLPDEAQEELNELQQRADKALEDSGNSNSVGAAGFAEGMIPVWGSGRDMINAIQTGNTAGAVMNGAFLLWDVASIAVGVVTFGAGTVAMQAKKKGVKGLIRLGKRKISRRRLRNLAASRTQALTRIRNITSASRSRRGVRADAPNTFRDAQGRLRNSNGRFARDPHSQSAIRRTTNSNRGRQLEINSRNGTRREIEVKNELLRRGHEVLGSQVSVKTRYTRRIIDHLIRDRNTRQIRAIEVKSGNARRNSSQILKDNSMAVEGGEIIGKNAPDFLRNRRLRINTEVIN